MSGENPGGEVPQERYKLDQLDKITGCRMRIEGGSALLTVSFQHAHDVGVQFAPHAAGLAMALDELQHQVMDAINNGYEIMPLSIEDSE